MLRKKQEKADPVLDPDCADAGSSAIPLKSGTCPAWVSNGGHCRKGWAKAACAKSCKICDSCTLGAWGSLCVNSSASRMESEQVYCHEFASKSVIQRIP